MLLNAGGSGVGQGDGPGGHGIGVGIGTGGVGTGAGGVGTGAGGVGTGGGVAPQALNCQLAQVPYVGPVRLPGTHTAFDAHQPQFGSLRQSPHVTKARH